MIQQQTILRVSDNSGAKTAKCIKVLGGARKKTGTVGDTIIVSIQQLRNKAKKTSKVKKGEIYKALIIRTKTKTQHTNKTTFTFFNDNAISLISKQNNPIATRIFGPISKKIKHKYLKFASISNGFA